MYARNSSSPKPITVGTVVKISDGVVQTTGVTVKTSKDGAAYATGGGSLSVEDGEWSYLPTQAETDCESLRIVIAKTDCYSRSITVVFTASSSFGYAGTDQSKIANATATIALTNTTVGIVTDVTTKSGYSLSSGGIAAIFATLTNTLTTVGSVGKLIVDNLNAAVGSIPTNPLLTNDSRLNNLNAPIGSIPTNPLLTTDSRLNNLNAPIGSIPTNPLLTTDARLNNLDATISSRSVYAGADTNGTTTLLSRLTSGRATNLDFLDAAISSVLSGITGLNNLSAKCNLFGSALLEVPETGSIVYEFNLVVKDDEDKLVNLDAAPTVTATNAAGTNRSGNLSAVTTVATGRYRFTYTVASTHAKESLRIEASGTVSTETRYAIWNGSVVDYDTLTILQSVQTTVNSINTRLPSLPAAVSDIPTANQNRDAVMNAMPSGGWINGSFGDRWIISNNSNRTIGVTGTGSGHVQVDVHAMQPDVMTASALATDAVAEIQSGLSTLTSAGIRDAIGLATNNLDTQLSLLPTIRDLVVIVDNVADAIEVDTQNIQSRIPASLINGRIAANAEIVGDKTGYSLIQAFPTNFASLGINVSGHISRVTLVDTNTTNTDMITATSIRSAVGLASANLDAQLNVLPIINGYLDTEIVAIKSKTDQMVFTTSGRLDSTAVAVLDKTGYTLSQAFPTNFSSLNINIDGKVLLQPTQTGVTIPTVTSITNFVGVNSIGTNVITSDVLATSAVDEIRSGLALETTSQSILSGVTTLTSRITAGVASMFQDLIIMIQGTGTALAKWTATALSLAPTGTGGAGNITVNANILPIQSYMRKRVESETMALYYAETTDVFISVEDENGPVDLTSKTLEFVIETKNKTNLLVIASNDIGKSANGATVRITTTVTNNIGTYLWALRDLTGGTDTVLSQGYAEVSYAPKG